MTIPGGFASAARQSAEISLKGNRAGQYSIRVNDQFRICFLTASGWFLRRLNRQVLEKLGGRTKARTWNPMIKSLMFMMTYQLLSCKSCGFGA
jgi:hypothetical protein